MKDLPDESGFSSGAGTQQDDGRETKADKGVPEGERDQPGGATERRPGLPVLSHSEATIDRKDTNSSANVPSQSKNEPLGDRGHGDKTWTREQAEQGISNRPDDEVERFSVGRQPSGNDDSALDDGTNEKELEEAEEGVGEPNVAGRTNERSNDRR